MIAIKPDMCYTVSAEANGTRGVLLFNAIGQHNMLLWAKRPPCVDSRPAIRFSNDGKHMEGVLIMTKMSWEWIAGFFEGEGCVHWYNSRTKTKQGICGRVFIGQKKKEPLQAIYDFLEAEGFNRVSLYLRKQCDSRKSLGRHCEIWVLCIQQRDEVIRFLENIVDFLFQKKEKAEFVITSLKSLRDERDNILNEAIRLKNSGLTIFQVTRQLGIRSQSLTDYARSKGITLRDNRKENAWRQDRVDRGLCSDCGKPRREDGTSRLCRECADVCNKRVAAIKTKRKTEGLCVTCGKPKGQNGTMTLCRDCADKKCTRKRAS